MKPTVVIEKPPVAFEVYDASNRLRVSASRGSFNGCVTQRATVERCVRANRQQPLHHGVISAERSGLQNGETIYFRRRHIDTLRGVFQLVDKELENMLLVTQCGGLQLRKPAFVVTIHKKFVSQLLLI